MRAASLLGMGLAICAWANDAPAQDATACIQAYEQTQTLRREGKLREAREEAAKCARDTCPPVLAKDCTKWLGEIEGSIPTIVFEVKGTSGEELTNVRVSLDGAVIAERLEGKAIPIDPGEHTLRVEPLDGKGSPPLEQKVVIHEGDRNRKITVGLQGKKTESRPIPLAAFVFGGAAAVSLGAGAFFAIRGSGQESDLDACKPACSKDAINDASQSYAIADILLTAGIVSAIAGVYVFLSRPAVSSAAALSRPAAVGWRF